MEFVDNAIDPQTGTIRAHAVVANHDHFLTPGLFGRARLLGSGSYTALLIPDEAITADQSRKLVMVLGRDGKVAARGRSRPGPKSRACARCATGSRRPISSCSMAWRSCSRAPRSTRGASPSGPRAPDTSPAAPTVTVPQSSTAKPSGAL